MADDLFNAADDQQDIDPNKNYLNELVGEGKKFKSPEELARGKFESDNYIKLLERRMDEMRTDYLGLRDEYNTRAKLEEVIDRLTTRQPQANSDLPNANDVNTQPSFDPKQVEDLFDQRMRRYEAERKQQENYNMLESKLRERYGDRYKSAFQSAINRAGIDADLAKDLAVRSPDVLLKAIGFDAPSQQEFQAPPSSDRGFAPQTREKRTWSYYEKMRKEQPDLYSSPKITIQMQQDYALLGKEFEDGDFNH